MDNLPGAGSATLAGAVIFGLDKNLAKLWGLFLCTPSYPIETARKDVRHLHGKEGEVQVGGGGRKVGDKPRIGRCNVRERSTGRSEDLF